MTTWPKERRIIGTKVPRIDGPDKAAGRAKYSYDINRKGLLHGVILRSPYPHAKITKLDTTAAEKMPGVKAIHIIGIAIDGTFVKVDEGKKTLTYKVKQGMNDVEKTIDLAPGVRLFLAGKLVAPGDLKPDDKIMIEVEQNAVGKELYYAGDEILGLAAETEEQARDALHAIKIEYEKLPAFVLEQDALKAEKAQTVPPVGGNRDNVRPGGESTAGDFAAALKMDGVVVYEGEYGVSVICHQCLESHGLVAEWDEAGQNLTAWASTQAVVATAGGLAQALKVPATQVKCITQYMGGGFGSKFGPDIQGIVAAELARKAKAAVKMMLDREAEITTAGNRPSVYGKVTIAATKDGKLVAYGIEAYGTPGVGGGAGINVGQLPYVYTKAAIPNVQVKNQVIRLNAGGQRAYRAPNHPQNCVMTDCPIDDLAAKLKMDPMEVRLKNLPPNDPQAVANDPISLAAIRGTLYSNQIKKAAELADWAKKWHPPGEGGKGVIKRGIGMAIHTWGGNAGKPNKLTVTISSDGSVLFQGSTQDLGTAERTVLAIIAAEVLGLEPKDVTVRIGESPYGPSSGSGGSTTCPGTAPPAYQASLKARDALFGAIAPRLMAKPEDLVVEVGKITDKASKKSWSWKEACGRLGMDTATGIGEWKQGPAAADDELVKDKLSNQGVGGVQIAEVAVDTETGVVRCTRFVAVQDCGLIINKQGCESQVAGGVVMGVNAALFEERIMDRNTGRQVNADMEFYKIGGIKDMPEIVVHMMDMPERGVIGIGEPPTISTMAAIGNAIFNAIGVRVSTAPYTPERVLAALQKGGK